MQCWPMHTSPLLQLHMSRPCSSQSPQRWVSIKIRQAPAIPHCQFEEPVCASTHTMHVQIGCCILAVRPCCRMMKLWPRLALSLAVPVVFLASLGRRGHWKHFMMPLRAAHGPIRMGGCKPMCRIASGLESIASLSTPAQRVASFVCRA